MQKANNKFKLVVPHTYFLIFMLMVIAAIATYLVPAGVFERAVDEVTGRTLVVPSSYEVVESTPVGFMDVFKAIPKGMTDSGWIIFLVFMIGGSFGIINSTGAIEAGIGRAVKHLEGKEIIIIPVCLAIFALGGATFGLAESTLIFIPMGITLARSLGYDALVGMSIITVGATSGFAGGVLNMFTTGVAQGIAGLPLFSGMGVRIVTTVIFVIISSAYILKYASKVKKNPELSIVYELEQKEASKKMESKVLEFKNRHKLVLLVVLIGFIFIIYGVTHGWSTGTDLSAIFLIMGIVSGVIYGFSPNKIAETFVEGAKSLTYGALVIGLSRAIVVILESGQIIDTIVYGASRFVGLFPPIIAVVIMLLFQLFFNFIVNSGSGQASITMPIMAPLADMVGVTRQTSVLAFQIGDGLSNQLWPTSGVLMAGLSLADIPYDKWLKYIMPLMVWLHIAAAVVLIGCVLIGYGPF